MKKLMEARVSSGIILLVLLMLLVSMSNVQAQANNLPTSEYPTKGEWRKMNPSTFPGTTDSALEQCRRAMRADRTGRLTAEKCKQFESMLRVGFCEVVTVPDGIVHDFMNQRVGGQSTLLPNVVKRIGRTDRAQLCDLGDGVFAYWYTGDGSSCNNVGITLARSRVPAPVSVPELVVVPVTASEVQPVARVTCRFKKVEVVQTPSTFTHVSDFVSCGCYIPGYTGVVQGGIQTSSELVCE